MIDTRQASPRLASQAASVRITKDMNSSLEEESRIIIKVNVNITASRASRAIKR